MKYQYFTLHKGIEVYYFVQIFGLKQVNVFGINKDGYVKRFSYEDVQFLRDDEVVAKKLLGEIL